MSERAALAHAVAKLTACALLAVSACATDDASSSDGGATRADIVNSDVDASSTDTGLLVADAGTDALVAPTWDGSAQDAAPAHHDLDAAVSDSDSSEPALTVDDLPYVQEVLSFTAGDHAGFGEAEYPEIVFGPPVGKGTSGGSLDVLSLGVGGTIVLGFGDLDIVDGPGADFVVFENSFWAGGDATKVFAEPGEVAVSEDGETWHTFPCDADGDGQGHYAGCAGWTPTLVYDPLEVFPLDAELTGGDAFDLEDLGVTRARYVRVRDVATVGASNNGGFDLDAAGLIHYEAR